MKDAPDPVDAEAATSPGRYRRIKELFASAADLDPESRASFLARVCSEEPTLAAEVSSLLGALEHRPSFLATDLDGPHEVVPATLLLPTGEAAPLPPLAPQTQITTAGPRHYEILRTLGEGGMGAVYLAARRDGEVEQTVALKLIRPGLETSREVLRRFHAERHILAALEHPHIARLLDGGTSADGLPYLVMEYVEGEPIDLYCQRRQLSLKHRLELMQTVCETVHFAHQKLVVHRDLKPNNILVTGDGTPKLLDFGIARLLDPEAHALDTVTRTGFQPMTPRYASPEQIRGRAVSTASDIYALGVILYELLTGHSPHAHPGQSLPELARAICEREPERPSTAAREHREDPASSGHSESEATPTPNASAGSAITAMPNLHRHLRGDLDHIILKALRKEPSARYTSAERLAEDLQRHRQGLPVFARRGTWRYRSQKFLHRHRLAVAAAGLLLALLIAWSLQARQQWQQTVRERDKAQRITSLLVDVFQVADPGSSHGETVTAREILDGGAAKLRQELAEEPSLRAELLHTLGVVYRNLGLYSAAEELLTEALTEHRTSGDTTLQAETLHELGLTHMYAGDTEAAAVALEEAVAGLRTTDRRRDIAQSLNSLAILRRDAGEDSEAEPLLREALEIQERWIDPALPDIAYTLNTLGQLHQDRGDYGAAETHFRRALEHLRESLGEDHPDTILMGNNLAVLVSRRGDAAAAASLYRQALTATRRVLGEEHFLTAVLTGNLASALRQQGDHAAAEPLYRQAVELWLQHHSERHVDIAICQANLGRMLHAAGRLDEAEALYLEILQRLDNTGFGDNPQAARVRAQLGQLYGDRGDPLAGGLLRRATQELEAAYGPNTPRLAIALRALGRWQIQAAETRAAEASMRRALAIQAAALPPEHPQLAMTHFEVGCLLIRDDTAGGAAELRRAMAILESYPSPNPHLLDRLRRAPDSCGEVPSLIL